QREMSEQANRLTAEREIVCRQVAVLTEDEVSQTSGAAEEEGKLAERMREHASWDAKASEHRQVIAKAQAEIASVEAKLAGYARRRLEMATRRDKLCAEREQLEGARLEDAARVAELARSIDDLRAGRVTTAEEKARVEQRLVELKSLVTNQERALEESKGQLSKRRSRCGALEEMHARLEGVGAGPKALVGTRDACIAGLVADRIGAPAELTQALAGLLGSKLEDVVVRDMERATALLEDLAKGRKGRATIVSHAPPFVSAAAGALPKDDAIVGRLADGLRFAQEDEALVRALVGDALVVRDLPSAVRLRAMGVGHVLVTVQGSVLHRSGRIEGGLGDQVAAGMIDGKREARDLAQEIERLDAVVEGALKTLQASRAELVQAGVMLDRARHDAHAGELALVTAEKDLQKAQIQMEAVSRRLEALVTEEEELGHAIDEAGVEQDDAGRVLSERRALVEQAESERHASELALTEAREKLNAQQQALTVRKVAIAGARERLAAAQGTEARLTRSAEELDERAARLEEELFANASAFGETAAQLVVHKTNVQEALDVAQRAEDHMGRVRIAFEALRSGLLERESALKELRGRADAARQELQKHELALRERQLAMDHLLAGVADKFRGLDLARVVGDHHMRAPPDDASRARIEELVRLLERMGSVNLDAMREHAEAEERFTFYSTQKADLDRAMADLTRAIQQMNRESRRLFEETFEAVNARFREIFPRMFRGGRAELRLTNSEDMLETGIDIVAQPPGKKLSSIELMSGGEKALTAVSLVFAMFQIKPSPFCILDEVDAPLDEANVARYNDMVRSMTDRSQFILI
ncbi:MAG: chromosome segregation protein SMC, partial [Polyangiaceae bacterium]